MRDRAKKSAKQERRAALGAIDTCHDEPPAKALVTTSQAARIAGVSPSTIVRNRSELGAVPGPNGAFLFDTEIVRQKITTIQRRQTIAAMGPSSGEIASAVFSLLKQGKHSSDIVVDLRISPEVVLALKQSYDAMHAAPQGTSPRSGPCRCGAGRAAVWCPACTIPLDLPTIETRSHDGVQQVRVVAQITWGRLPQPREDGVTSLVYVELAGEWLDADSVAAHELAEAQHPSRGEAR